MPLLFFITKSYFGVSKNIRQNSTPYFVTKIPNKTELQQISFNHSSDIDLQGFMNLCKKCTAKPYSFLVIYIAFRLIILYLLERILYFVERI